MELLIVYLFDQNKRKKNGCLLKYVLYFLNWKCLVQKDENVLNRLCTINANKSWLICGKILITHRYERKFWSLLISSMTSLFCFFSL